MKLLNARPGCSPANDPRGGQAIILASLTMTVIFGTLGLATDLGWSYFLKGRLQTAADAAASAAVVYAINHSDSCSTITCGVSYTCTGVTPPTTSLQAGCLYATADGPSGLTVKMIENNAAHPPAGLTGTTPSMWIQATITTSQNNFFLFLGGFHTASIKAQAISGVYSGGGGGCVYVLNASAAGAWSQSGGTFTTGCGVYVNSNSATAYHQSGGIDTFNGGSNLYIVGNKSTSGGIVNFNGGGSAETGQTSFSNPVSGLTGPTPGSPCTADPNISGGNSNPIASGTYCSLTISGGNGIVFSGTYIITTGNFTIVGGNYSTAGGGATIYIPASNSTGSVQISGGNGTLTAPSSGSLSGFAIWQNNSVAATVSGSNDTVNGIIYMPSASLTYSGSNTAATMSIVVNTITMSGGNISQPATSGFFSNGASFSGGTIIQ
jgi:hypothetical protein